MNPAMKRTLGLLLPILCAVLCLPAGAWASGLCLYPTGGYLVHLTGDAGHLQSAPAYGARLEYNFSSTEVRAIGLVYSYSQHGLDGQPASDFIDQHLAMLGYRFGRDWEWLSFGSQMGMGAVVREAHGHADPGFSAGYCVQGGISMGVRPSSWLEIGPDLSFLLATDIDQWIFGGQSSYFFYIGGHVALCF
jgi:hypothetical protein